MVSLFNKVNFFIEKHITAYPFEYGTNWFIIFYKSTKSNTSVPDSQKFYQKFFFKIDKKNKY